MLTMVLSRMGRANSSSVKLESRASCSAFFCIRRSPAPGPSMRNLVRHIWITRSPLESFMRARRIADQHRRVSGSTRAQTDRDIVSGNLASTLDKLEHRPAPAGANIDGFAFATVQQRAQRKHVRIGEIGDMDIVANTAAVRSRVVSPKHGESITLSGRRIQQQWNHMRLRHVAFS